MLREMSRKGKGDEFGVSFSPQKNDIAQITMAGHKKRPRSQPEGANIRNLKIKIRNESNRVKFIEWNWNHSDI